MGIRFVPTDSLYNYRHKLNRSKIPVELLAVTAGVSYDPKRLCRKFFPSLEPGSNGHGALYTWKYIELAAAIRAKDLVRADLQDPEMQELTSVLYELPMTMDIVAEEAIEALRWLELACLDENNRSRDLTQAIRKAKGVYNDPIGQKTMDTIQIFLENFYSVQGNVDRTVELCLFS